MLRCQECGKTFENIGLLRKHQLDAHPKKPKETKEPKKPLIPAEFCPDIKYLSDGRMVKLECIGKVVVKGKDRWIELADSKMV